MNFYDFDFESQYRKELFFISDLFLYVTKLVLKWFTWLFLFKKIESLQIN